MRTLAHLLARRLRRSLGHWRRSAVRVVTLDGTEIYWDRCDDLSAARDLALARLAPDAVAFAWEPAIGRRVLVLADERHLPAARRIARQNGWPMWLTRVELARPRAEPLAGLDPRGAA